jgi:glycerol uptake facilitator protein
MSNPSRLGGKPATTPAIKEVGLPHFTDMLIAEALGTFLLVLIGNGAGVALTYAGVLPTASGLLVAALAHGLALAVIINTIGRISGAHVNPAVTIGLASVGRFPWRQVPEYIAAQFVGAAVAVGAILAIFGSKVVGASVPTLSPGINGLQGLLAEALGAFILIFAVVATAGDNRYKLPEGWAGLVIGLALACGIFLAGAATGAGLNPALAVSPYGVVALINQPVPGGEIPVYLFGPVIGGLVAAYLYSVIADMPRQPRTRTGQSEDI